MIDKGRHVARNDTSCKSQHLLTWAQRQIERRAIPVYPSRLDLSGLRFPPCRRQNSEVCLRRALEDQLRVTHRACRCDVGQQYCSFRGKQQQSNKDKDGQRGKHCNTANTLFGSSARSTLETHWVAVDKHSCSWESLTLSDLRLLTLAQSDGLQLQSNTDNTEPLCSMLRDV